MTGRATNAMLLQGAAPRERGQSTGAFAVRLVAGPRRSTAVHGTALCGALIALALEGSVLLFCWYFSACHLPAAAGAPSVVRTPGSELGGTRTHIFSLKCNENK